jgi:hypothetical protein
MDVAKWWDQGLYRRVVDRPTMSRVRSRTTHHLDHGTIRVLNLIMITKESEGAFDAIELNDFEDGALGELHRLETEIAELLSADDSPEVG